MKPTNQHIKGLARKLFHHKPGLERPKLMHPKRDWLIGVLVGAVAIIIMIGWSAYTYIDRRDAIDLEDTNIEAEIPVYKSALVEEALELFAQREEMFVQLDQSSTVVEAPAVESADVATTTATITSTSTNATSTADVTEEGVINTDPNQPVAPALIPPNPISGNEGSTGTPTLSNE